ncbi:MULTISPECIES: hypothetical protein [Paenibacillus]|uniref:Uncharacterized protein n=1 Tax=Paenibacillus vandeheii TaxID=3035917 RepID=A0ABT8JFQ0_9BACL|nr:MULTISPECIES: hypothetical protein [Paenibacillus]KGP81941.1 hypothetical protein P364_0114040 [Paenibacillus sp. MAEPY2]KGP86027.1 hypothetical protein P363_0119515 [Paenibacillus sp. MAEPY1]MDN4603855.1 hypothetical protein [Paenibacillus vandeheii]
MEEIPKWVLELAEKSEYEYHFHRLKKIMNQDEMYNLLVVEAAELDIEEIVDTSYFNELLASFNALTVSELHEKYGKGQINNTILAYEQLKLYYDQYFNNLLNKGEVFRE